MSAYLTDEEAAVVAGLTVDRISRDKARAINPLPYLPVGNRRMVVAATLLPYYQKQEVGSADLINELASAELKSQIKDEIMAELFPQVMTKIAGLGAVSLDRSLHPAHRKRGAKPSANIMPEKDNK